MLKIRSVLLNSKAAIDLASIMVGIIVIGLIGGVIAATVFAVIPWAQDNAAKQQLESIHTAQNAGFGLSADPSRELVAGQERNSFTNSQGLDAAGLLTLSPTGTYCTVNFDGDGSQNYIGWVKSASGKVFYATNNSKTVKEQVDGIFPCVVGAPVGTGEDQIPVGGYNPNPVDEAGNPVRDSEGNPVVVQPGSTAPGATPVNPGTGNGGGSGGGSTNPPPAPQPVLVTSYDFEQNITGWSYAETGGTVGQSSNYAHTGTHSLVLTRSNTSATVRKTQNQLVVGETYRVTAWVYSVNPVSVSASPRTVSGATVNVSGGTWTKVENDFVATNTSTQLSWAVGAQGNSKQVSVWLDDVNVSQLP